MTWYGHFWLGGEFMTEPNYETELRVAQQAARAAGERIMKSWDRDFRLEFKGEVDLVTEVDRDAEHIILKVLNDAFSKDTIVAEEGGGGVGSSSRTWYIDPLDGTTNFAHGLPHFCVSIGLVSGETPVLGVIYEPVRNLMFTANGQGTAAMNNRPISVSATKQLGQSLLATGFPYDRRTSLDNNMPQASALLRQCQGLRRAGAAALDLAYVACGWLDGYWEDKLHPWDMTAGCAIVEGAGGRVSRFDESDIVVTTRQCLATNGLIHSALSRALADVSQDC